MTGGDLPFQPGDDPFANLPLFGDLAKALSGQGPLNWDAARQFAAIASGSSGSEPNVDPAVRIHLADLARIAAMHVHDLTGTDTTFPEFTPVTRGTWAARTLEAYRPLFTDLAVSLGGRPADSTGAATEAGADPMTAMMAGLSRMMAPSMMGMAIGSMVGRMATRAFGQYDLPIPRDGDTLLVVPANIDAFAGEWGLPLDEMRLWVLAQELVGHTLFSMPSLRRRLADLVRSYVAAFRPDPDAVVSRISEIGIDGDADPMAAMQRLLGDPAVLLGAVQSAEQTALAPHLDAAVAAVVGYIDYTVDSVAVRVVGGDALRIAEAVRRRRVETSPDDLFVERLLGMHLDLAQVQRGKEFVAGVVDRVGEARLTALFAADDPLPTPAELEAPGLWVARLEL